MNQKPHDNRLKSDAVGLGGVLFMSIATASPITSMVGNLPIAVGFGNGAGAPAGFLIATIVLLLFALGFSAMAKYVSTTGAFYGFVTQGLGKPLGFCSGILTTFAYCIFEASVIGGCAFYATDFINTYVHIHCSWPIIALFIVVINGIFSYAQVDFASKVLAVLLAAEIAMLALGGLATLFHGGGPEGWSLGSLNPINGLKSMHLLSSHGIILQGSAGVGLLFAFWSWVGFESSAMYAEESKDPKRIIPIAITTTVVGVGIFYVIISWLAIVGTGPHHSIEIAQNSNTAGDILFTPVRLYLGTWAIPIFKLLMITGSYACCLAFHNCACRYLYSLGRENVIPGVHALGKTHKKFQSPHIAGIVQACIAAIIVLGFALFHKDPYAALFTIGALVGTAAILLVQALVAFSVISYFHVLKKETESAHWFRTCLAPLLGGIGMLYVIYQLFTNSTVAVGTEASNPIYKEMPWIIITLFVISLIGVLYFKYFNQARYTKIGGMSNQVKLGSTGFAPEITSNDMGETMPNLHSEQVFPANPTTII